jgi:hypothetical protein
MRYIFRLRRTAIVRRRSLTIHAWTRTRLSDRHEHPSARAPRGGEGTSDTSNRISLAIPLITARNGPAATSVSTPSRSWAEAERRAEGHGTMTTVGGGPTAMATT